MYKIEKGVPVPTAAVKYPWREMVHGDSFLVPEPQRLRSICSQCSNWTQNSPYKFRARLVDGGVRVWCTTKDK